MVSSALDHNKPRVLVSGLSNGLGGTEIVVGRYIKALSSYATFEFLATSDLSDVAFVHEMNSEIHICPDIDRPIKRFEYLDHLFRDEPNRYQAVWCNFNHLLYADVLRAAQRANVSVRIAHSHNSRFLGGLPTQVLSRFNRHVALRNSNVRLACSKEAGSFFWGDNFQVLPNALDFNDMEYDPVSRIVIREEFGLSPKDFLIGTVGRLTSQKNHIFLLKIMKELLTVKSNCKLMIVGDGPLHKSLQESAATLGISSSVLFAGERKDIKDILSSFDCFVFPSTFEGLGVAAIEAQLNGLPCVCSFGVPDAADISDKFLKCSFNVDEWIDAIISMNRPNKLAGGRLFMTSTSKQVNCCQSSLVDNPLVSVIVPMYNAEKTIQKTLNSLQRQSVSNIEIIIVDDGSTDRGAELVMAIAEGDNRIKLISQNNSGVCVARNRGVDEASGDWVAFVDADDILPINAVKLLLESSDDCSLVVGALLNERCDNSSKAISIGWETACSLSLAFWDNVNKVPFPSFANGVAFRSVCGKIFNKSLFRNGSLKFEDGIRFGEDALFMVDAYRLAENVKVVDSAVYCYVNNSDSVTRNTDISAIEDVDNLLIKLYELCLVNPDLNELYKQSAVREVLSLIRNLARFESNQLYMPVSNMVCQPYFSYLMEGFASHRYSRRLISEVKNRITIRLLLARRVMAAIGFTKFVYGVC